MTTQDPVTAFPSTTGFVKSPEDARDLQFVPAAPPVEGLPRVVDMSGSYPPPLAQGQSNTCTSNATANALLHVTTNGNKVQQSRLFIYWNARVQVAKWGRYTDTGLCIRDAMKAVEKYNSIAETSWPFDPVQQRFSMEPSPTAWAESKKFKDKFAYRSVQQTELAIKAALSGGHPIVLGILLLESFYNPEAGGYVKMSGPQVGWHAVGLIGYDDSKRRFKFQNSWGPEWGDRGFFTLDYDWVLNPATASDLWVLDSFTDGAPSPAPKPTPIPTPKPTPIPTPAPAPFSGNYTIQNSDTKRFMAVNSAKKVVGANGRQLWTFAPSADAGTFTIRPRDQKLRPGFLSVNTQTNYADLWSADDASGRQRFTLVPTGRSDEFTIKVARGLADPSRPALAECVDLGTVLVPTGSGQSTWIVRTAV